MIFPKAKETLGGLYYILIIPRANMMAAVKANPLNQFEAVLKNGLSAYISV